MDTPQSPLPPTPVQSAPQMPDSTSSPQAATKSKLWLRMLLGVLAVAAGYFAYASMASLWPFAPTETPSPSPTASTNPTTGWKTYLNTKYGYSIQYPESWKVIEGGAQGNPKLDSQGFSTTGTQSGYDIAITENLFASTDAVRAAYQPHLKTYTQSQIKLGSVTWWKITTAYATNTGDQLVTYYFVAHNGNTFFVEFVDSPIKLQILSTFMFTSVTTGSSKTYANADYGFSFNIPSEWRTPTENVPPESTDLLDIGVGPSGGPVIHLYVSNETNIDAKIAALTAAYGSGAITTRENISVGGKAGVLVTMQVQENTYWYAFFINNGFMYTLVNLAQPPTTYQAGFDQILSTFTFTK